VSDVAHGPLVLLTFYAFGMLIIKQAYGAIGNILLKKKINLILFIYVLPYHKIYVLNRFDILD
jgi:hypothetical protein